MQKLHEFLTKTSPSTIIQIIQILKKSFSLNDKHMSLLIFLNSDINVFLYLQGMNYEEISLLLSENSEQIISENSQEKFYDLLLSSNENYVDPISYEILEEDFVTLGKKKYNCSTVKQILNDNAPRDPFTREELNINDTENLSALPGQRYHSVMNYHKTPEEKRNDRRRPSQFPMMENFANSIESLHENQSIMEESVNPYPSITRKLFSSP
jgi:hypothetical protein